MESILTVNVPAATYDLTTEDAARAELAMLGSQDVSSDLLISWIRQASGQCARFCDRVFARETVTEQFRLCSGWRGRLDLRRFPVSEITSITEDDAALDVADYELDSERGKLLRLSSSAPGYWANSKIVVSYTGGYELLGTLPYEVERACLSLVRSYAARHSQNPLLRSEEVPGVQRFDYQVNQIGTHGDMPPDAVALLRPFVVYTV